MRIDNAVRRLAFEQPVYLALPGDEIVGVGSDSAAILNASIYMIRYVRALETGTVSAVEGDASDRRQPSIYYSELRRQLDALMTAPEFDEFGVLRPYRAAIDTASEVAFRIVRAGIEPPAPADVSVDRDGDVRILWEYRDRTLELVCPSEPGRRAYIYYSDAEQYYVAYDLSIYRIGRLFGWLSGRSRDFPR